MKIMKNLGVSDWQRFVLSRLNELHPFIFGVNQPETANAYVYFTYNKVLNEEFYAGTDYSDHPRNPLKRI